MTGLLILLSSHHDGPLADDEVVYFVFLLHSGFLLVDAVKYQLLKTNKMLVQELFAVSLHLLLDRSCLVGLHQRDQELNYTHLTFYSTYLCFMDFTLAAFARFTGLFLCWLFAIRSTVLRSTILWTTLVTPCDDRHWKLGMNLVFLVGIGILPTLYLVSVGAFDSSYTILG